MSDGDLHPPDPPKITGLPWETIAEELRTCPARIRLAILDCCFAGQAIETLGAGDSEGLADITHVDGVYTLAATTRNRTAHVLPANQQDTACTSFTGELQDLIRSGIAGKPPRLTFGDIYPELRQRLRAKGLPAPSQRGTDTAHQFPFTVNTAAALSEVADTGIPRATDPARLLPGRGSTLVIQAGDQTRLFRTEFTAGSADALLIHDEQADNHHAVFQPAHGYWFITDLNSTNGTWLNGRRISAPQRLKEGDKIMIGRTVLTIVST